MLQLHLSNLRTGKKDKLNGVLGGAAAGAVLGTAIGRMPVGVGAAALLAASSLAVDLSGHSLIDDGATPPRLIFPCGSLADLHC